MDFPLIILDNIDKVGYSNDSLAKVMPNPGKWVQGFHIKREKL